MKSVRLSGHHKGIAIDVAVYTLGATWIERHFTLDRTWKGPDHAAYLRPDGLRKLRHGLDAAFKAFKFKEIDFLEIEKKQATKLCWDRKLLNNVNNKFLIDISLVI